MENKELVDAYSVIVRHLRNCVGEDESALSNFEGTPERCARALLHFSSDIDSIRKRLGEIIQRSFPVSRKDSDGHKHAGMVTQGPLQVSSLCPHHLYPVIYECWISYIPKLNGNVLGLSKFSRLVKVLSARPILQEQLASDIADVLYKGSVVFPGIDSEGSAVSMIGLHTCMSCRGVEQRAVTTTTELRGVYWEQELEQKFQSAISLSQQARNTI